jgi:hypothetical protein
MKFLSGLVAGALLTAAVPVSAQSLGDLAKKEAERRKASPPAAKTYTNEDLKQPPSMNPEAGSRQDPTKVEDSAKPVAPADEAAKAAKDADPAKDQTYWHARITAAKEEARRNEMFREALKTRIEVLSANVGGIDGTPFYRAQLNDDRVKAIAEMARVTSELEKATKQIADIEEEARKAGIPPGWIR